LYGYPNILRSKTQHVETISGLGGGRVKENDGGGELNWDIL
jgi:hypothetical protein